MALVFYTSPEAPVQCAVEISRALKEHPRLQLRMGIHSGPVSGVVDVNERANLAGAGINMAQRVMDCGDAGHILAFQACRRRSRRIRAVATAPARSWRMRSETWRARLGREPLRRSIRQCEAAAEIRDRPETPGPNALGGKWRQRCSRSPRLSLASSCFLRRPRAIDAG